jgi:hypothetical protein
VYSSHQYPPASAPAATHSYERNLDLIAKAKRQL